MKKTADAQKPAVINHDLVRLPSVALLTVRVTNVHSGWWVNLGAVPTRAGQLSTGPQHWNPTSDTSLIWTKSVPL